MSKYYTTFDRIAEANRRREALRNGDTDVSPLLPWEMLPKESSWSSPHARDISGSSHSFSRPDDDDDDDF